MSTIAVHPKDVTTFYAGGAGNMAEALQVKDSSGNGIAFCLCSVRVHFTGTTAVVLESYPVRLYVDSNKGPAYDAIFWTWDAVGEYSESTITYFGLSLRIPDSDLRDFIIPAGDYLGLSWTNPAPTTTKWTATVNVIAVDKIRD